MTSTSYPRSSKSVLIFDPIKSSWFTVSNMTTTRAEHGQSTLLDGRVLVTGGVPDAHSPEWSAVRSTEFFDPRAVTWRGGAQMIQNRCGHGQSTLLDGRVLVTGGFLHSVPRSGEALDSAEVFDPRRQQWFAVANLPIPLGHHAQSTLRDGRVLLTGGLTSYHDSEMTSYSLIYDPRANAWTMGSCLLNPRGNHTQSTLLDGRTLICGGSHKDSRKDMPTNIIEFFHPVAQRSKAVALASETSAPDAPKKWTCTKCAASLSAELLFCSTCGTSKPPLTEQPKEPKAPTVTGAPPQGQRQPLRKHHPPGSLIEAIEKKKLPVVEAICEDVRSTYFADAHPQWVQITDSIDPHPYPALASLRPQRVKGGQTCPCLGGDEQVHRCRRLQVV